MCRRALSASSPTSTPPTVPRRPTSTRTTLFIIAFQDLHHPGASLTNARMACDWFLAALQAAAYDGVAKHFVRPSPPP